jgi:ATP synthase I chain
LNFSSSHSGSSAETEEIFYVRTYRRLVWIMGVLALAGATSIWIRSSGAMTLSFLAGSVISILNFHWLKRTLDAMGQRFQATGGRPSAWGVVPRFLLRYVLIAVAAYVIFKSTPKSLYAFFAGLSLPVGAILIEAVYETYKALRTGL